MFRVSRGFNAALIALIALGACAPAEENLAVLANARGTFAVGDPQRLLVGLLEPETSEFLASPEISATATLTAPDGKETTTEATFLWTVPDLTGLYRVYHTFDQEGEWWVRLNPSGYGPTPKTPFTVGTSDPVPGPGDKAPTAVTRTLADQPVEEISSDDDPNPAFYQLSLDEALSNGKPTVVVFATPAFCVSRTCGPMLDQVKAASQSHPDANYVHVEIYENLDANKPEDLRVVAAVRTWGLPSEPWVFVVDANGEVVARFEGAVTDDELEVALEAVGA
jgi:hypothetical protein